jgi:hypothetical protein
VTTNPILPPSQYPQPLGALRSEPQVSLLDGSINTYSASGVISSAFVGDVWNLQGAAGTVIRITHCGLALTNTTAEVINAGMQRRSTANSGGTFTNPAPCQHDVNTPGAAATLNSYTAAPTPGTQAGAMPRKTQVSADPTTGTYIDWEFGQGPHAALLLRGALDSLSMVLGAGAAGAVCTWDLTWTESPT